MAFSLNTESGYLHLDDHGGTANAETSDRADALDLRARELGLKLTFCKQCFGTNRNTETAERLAEIEERMLAGESQLGDSLTAPERVSLEAPPTSVHALDDAVPAGQDDLPTQPPLRKTPRTDQ